MRIEAKTKAEQRLLRRLDFVDHPVLRFAGPSMIAVAVALLALGVVGWLLGRTDYCVLQMGLFLFFIGFLSTFIVRERRTVRSLLNRLAENNGQNSQQLSGADAGKLRSTD